MDLSLRATDDRITKPGDFAGEVSDDGLELPRDLMSSLAELGVFSAAQLISYAASLPSALAAMLGWSVADVTRARVELESRLGDRLDGGAQSGARRARGARRPRSRDLNGS